MTGEKKMSSTERMRKWRAKNRDRHAEYMRDYRQSKRNDIWRENDPRKRKALIQATPPWADHEAIMQVYARCDEMNERYPEMGFVVHHDIPISHPQVCGLHVAENMRVVTSALKAKLGRKFHRN